MQSVVCDAQDGRESQRDGIVALSARRIVSITNVVWPVLLMGECRSFRARNLGGAGYLGLRSRRELTPDVTSMFKGCLA